MFQRAGQAATLQAITQTDLQDSQITSLADLAARLRQALTSAVGQNNGATVMTEANSIFDAASQILNAKDVNGNLLSTGDTVTVIKDLKVKGSSIPLKQGTVIRNIRLVDGEAEHIEGNSDKIKGLVLKTCFLKKA